MTRFEEIKRRLEEKSSLDFAIILDHCFNLFKKVWLKGFVVVLIVGASAMLINFLFTTLGFAPNDIYKSNDFSLELIFSNYYSQLINGFPQSILIGFISLGLLSGFYRICKFEEVNKIGNDEFFYYFKSEHFSKLLMLSIIFATIALVSQLLWIVPYIYTFVPLSFFAIIFSNNPQLTEMEIVKLSFNIGTKKWLLTFGLLFVTGIIGGLGVIACGIGLLFTISIVYLPVYFVYKDVVGFDYDDEVDFMPKINE